MLTVFDTVVMRKEEFQHAIREDKCIIVTRKRDNITEQFNFHFDSVDVAIAYLRDLQNVMASDHGDKTTTKKVEE